MNTKGKRSRSGSLSEQEARERLTLITDANIHTELYDFGKMLTSEAVSRVSRLDTKAAAIAAYAIGVITLLVSTSHGWAPRIHLTWLPISSGVAAFASAVCAVIALTLRTLGWFSPNDWLRAKVSQNVTHLTQYRILCMLAVIESWETVANTKAKWITGAQFILLLASLLLVACLIDALRIL